ncbi:unnamed protein product, partial [Ilex paraguariensis]
FLTHCNTKRSSLLESSWAAPSYQWSPYCSGLRIRYSLGVLIGGVYKPTIIMIHLSIIEESKDPRVVKFLGHKK